MLRKPWPLNVLSSGVVVMKKKHLSITPACAACDLPNSDRACVAETGKSSKGCPTFSRKKVLEDSNKEYEASAVRSFARQASIQEAECYANRHQRPYVMQPTKTRIVEICEFAEKMGYRRLGLAFCLGLAKEAAVVEEILKKNGFEVISVLCKAGRTPKEALGLKEEHKIFQGKLESMCNPIYQAKLLNHEKTDFNILLGLCVGHDSLFFKFAEAPTTVLAVKDRVTGHNPLAAIYLSGTYYQKLKNP
jgi:uncharacterized metal-binding protein